ncbi:hypothetical protein PIB30_003343 [Stylosanthes scabra]|uniref:Uncharacterized protein n=1 Tax=Stylosanthes scabra TaxID=79078 RepID=A0ABU6T2X8_9FABA|nr:hypothetical protein [Stylosanthes scabra]
MDTPCSSLSFTNGQIYQRENKKRVGVLLSEDGGERESREGGVGVVLPLEDGDGGDGGDVNGVAGDAFRGEIDGVEGVDRVAAVERQMEWPKVELRVLPEVAKME